MMLKARRHYLMAKYNEIRQSRRSSCLLVTGCVFALYLTYAWLNREPLMFTLPEGLDLSKYEPFEPLAYRDFGDGIVSEGKIPKIIHWVKPEFTMEWLYMDNLRSFVKFNPDWTFYLWTYESTRRLIKDRLPQLSELWEDHSDYKYIHTRRSELARYIVLYVYGGVMLDMRARNYRSLDRVVSRHSCIIPPNPFEEAIQTGVPYTLTNRVMMCRQHHPFLKLIVDNLHRYQLMADSYDAVGDGFLTNHYMVYNNLQREHDNKNIYVEPRKDTTDTSPFFFQGQLSKFHPNAVHVPNSVYFTGASDPGSYSTYIRTCSHFLKAPLLHQRACVHLNRRGLIRTPGKHTYIDLHNAYGGILGILLSYDSTLMKKMTVYGNKP